MKTHPSWSSLTAQTAPQDPAAHRSLSRPSNKTQTWPRRLFKADQDDDDTGLHYRRHGFGEDAVLNDSSQTWHSAADVCVTFRLHRFECVNRFIQLSNPIFIFLILYFKISGGFGTVWTTANKSESFSLAFCRGYKFNLHFKPFFNPNAANMVCAGGGVFDSFWTELGLGQKCFYD